MQVPAVASSDPSRPALNASPSVTLSSLFEDLAAGRPNSPGLNFKTARTPIPLDEKGFHSLCKKLASCFSRLESLPISTTTTTCPDGSTASYAPCEVFQQASQALVQNINPEDFISNAFGVAFRYALDRFCWPKDILDELSFCAHQAGFIEHEDYTLLSGLWVCIDNKQAKAWESNTPTPCDSLFVEQLEKYSGQQNERLFTTLIDLGVRFANPSFLEQWLWDRIPFFVGSPEAAQRVRSHMEKSHPQTSTFLDRVVRSGEFVHRFSLRGAEITLPSGFSLGLEGHLPQLTALWAASSLKAFIKTHRPDLSRILPLFQKASENTQKSADALLQDWQKGSPVFLPQSVSVSDKPGSLLSGDPCHTLGIVLQGDFIAICDCSGASKRKQGWPDGIVLGKLKNRSQATLSALKDLLSKSPPFEAYRRFITNEDLFERIADLPLKPQPAATCAWYSTRTSMLAACLLDKFSKLEDQSIASAKKVFDQERESAMQAYLQWTLVDKLESFLKYTRSPNPDPKLVEQAAKIIFTKYYPRNGQSRRGFPPGFWGGYFPQLWKAYQRTRAISSKTNSQL